MPQSPIGEDGRSPTVSHGASKLLVGSLALWIADLISMLLFVLGKLALLLGYIAQTVSLNLKLVSLGFIRDRFLLLLLYQFHSASVRVVEVCGGVVLLIHSRAAFLWRC